VPTDPCALIAAGHVAGPAVLRGELLLMKVYQAEDHARDADWRTRPGRRDRSVAGDDDQSFDAVTCRFGIMYLLPAQRDRERTELTAAVNLAAGEK
jgi:hypothetical protein